MADLISAFPAPRRASVDDIPAGRLTWEDAQRLKVLLDGDEQEYVIAYDCDAGTVTRFVTGIGGKPVFDEERQDLIRETVTGAVTVQWGQPPRT